MTHDEAIAFMAQVMVASPVLNTGPVSMREAFAGISDDDWQAIEDAAGITEQHVVQRYSTGGGSLLAQLAELDRANASIPIEWRIDPDAAQARLHLAHDVLTGRGQ